MGRRLTIKLIGQLNDMALVHRPHNCQVHIMNADQVEDFIAYAQCICVSAMILMMSSVMSPTNVPIFLVKLLPFPNEMETIKHG